MRAGGLAGIRVVIAGDEAGEKAGDKPGDPARLRTALLAHYDVEIVGEVENGGDAEEAIRKLRPDVVFLGVHTLGPNALGVASRLDAHERPLVVIVTESASHAVAAFAMRATDCLLEPVTDERLAASIERLREELRVRTQSRLYEEIRDLIDAVGDQPSNHDTAADDRPGRRNYASRITVRVGNRSLVVPVADIDWIQADGTYSAIHAGERRLVARETLDRLEARLDPSCFIRLHRSSLVNMTRIVELRHPPQGALCVVLRDGTELSVSRRRREAVVQYIGRSR